MSSTNCILPQTTRARITFHVHYLLYYYNLFTRANHRRWRIFWFGQIREHQEELARLYARLTG